MSIVSNAEYKLLNHFAAKEIEYFKEEIIQEEKYLNNLKRLKII